MASHNALNNPDSYAIAWIATLPIERAAVEAMLDEEHATPTGFTRHQTDANVYTWGRVGEHNVVIASLAAGAYGTTSAATTAGSLLASLPSIRVGLLVGIAGLTPRHATARLEWARTYSGYTPEDWDRVFWSDECTVERGIGERREYTFTPRSKQIEKRDVRGLPTPGKQVKQMFWAAFSWSTRRTGLIPLFGDPTRGRGGVNRFVIRDLYTRVLPTLMLHRDSIFQQDNASTLTAYIVREALAEMGIQVMDWPAKSPDLNPIENLWTLLKDKIYKICPELKNMPNNDTTHALLIRKAQEAWDLLDLSILENLSHSMPRRVQAILDAEGWYTKY
ncbi:uncharacterized protein N7473_004379 [Penicillium subrubescens]|uniref:Transposable element Tc1 transposase n=1 Tax=Penicillium subrubescens TaxID=1316194 RepID=A0A1Q5ULI7_9EURO|nr:uncharacterized protein N7473_004379 [Penicillium subrubescens]KAJ5900309.1 hypothetical protein N7473_004379 [Penicillium subrubescens]OKP13319.1 Transposable element Tc1 transposase [Penicillium subrubescens]